MKKRLPAFERIVAFAAVCAVAPAATAIDHPDATTDHLAPSRFSLVRCGKPRNLIIVDEAENSAVRIAAKNLADDFWRVTGEHVPNISDQAIIAGVMDGPTLKPLVESGKLKADSLKGRREQYLVTFVKEPREGIREALVVAGSDRRGAVYGIYEISEQIGVSPWYDWADAPLRWKAKDGKKLDLSIARGTYTNGEPAVRWRGIFLNDEAPCLTGWVKNAYGTDFGDRRFYSRVGELILRLRGNFLWPAMGCWAFYADDPENSKTLDAMGVAVGTSHHEPMGRNHQEWARRRKENGAWNYQTNKETLDRFFAEGVRRLKDTEDLVTIGMRGDGDEAMDGAGNLELMKTIISSQRRIIEAETGRKASDVPQVWALYKEVLDDYDRGLRPPDDVTILLCDDNWGNVRRLPNAEERKRSGGWGMYYHVDYVGAPRNSKFINCTSAMSMWEQMSLAYEYGVDRLWVLNVGDLKPMECPITLFLDMAWNPTRYTPSTLGSFTEGFCSRLFGAEEAKESARILDTTSRWACRCTPEMLDKDTYDLASGEWAKVADDYAKLAADAKAQYDRLPKEARDAYFEIVLFPTAVMANLYEMYYSQAMNWWLGKREGGRGKREEGKGKREEINLWADRVEAAFARHAELCRRYNEDVAGGKWNGMMRQKVIGYKSWSDGFPADICPKVSRVGSAAEKSLASERAIELLNAKEPRIYSVQRKKSFDSNMGENWWMRRHDAILEMLKPVDGKPKVFDLVLCGDSITHRWERHGAAAYVGVTNSLKVLNLGFGADNVKNLLWRLRSGELDGYRAKVVQLMIGTNNNPNEPAETTAAEIRACVREIRQRQPAAKILLCAILPRGNPDSVERGHNLEVNRLLEQVCDGKTVEWVDYGAFLTLPDGRVNPELSDDGLHPNAKGYAEWAKIALPFWKKAVAGGDQGQETLDERRGKAPLVSRPESHVQKSFAMSIDANRYAAAVAPKGYRWEFLPGLGRTLGAMEVFPRLGSPEGARLCYDVEVPEGVGEVDVTVVTRSTLAFARPEGHRYRVGFEGEGALEVNFNGRLNENKENIYSVFYPTVARRVVAKKVTLDVPKGRRAPRLVLAPLDPGVAFEKIVVSWGDGPKGYLFGFE